MSERISPHFRRGEFACSCGCGFDTVDHGTLEILEATREHFGVPVTVTSGCRCPEYNARIGGAAHSQHKVSRAADIQVKGVDPDEVHDWIDANFPFVSLGRYDTFTHVDTRSDGPARWDG
ncbi:D-Ala-D-Ala carboxypeptidase family metallohydrolase [Chromohalobacter nigrandesensis]|uniref:D-Ala-D-Ala carboxypeptidase family metallohydrolase n=1 Tax=Chromohalobacter nigrandesensis TaxID=119863 RepID=UPI001FF5BB01|nr:D-Ala-D-Ala carboxypeptidase family metallohydrolase [Chromohalobacter nigrandesensis]MCK0743579.1 D-Ala-D-Ala carboxypeptidase family metallohydrolase [Chromohalobacter nigrandesensis]